MAKPRLNRINTEDNTFYVPTVSDIAATDIPANETETPKIRQAIDLTEPQILPGIGEIAMISLDLILDSPYQTREHRDEDEFLQLVYSIKTLKQRLLLFVCHHPKKQEYYFP